MAELRHAFLQSFKVQFKRGWTGHPDEIRVFRGFCQISPINFPHTAPELVALGGYAEPLGREESDSGRIGLGWVERQKIKRHPAIVHTTALEACGIEDGSPTDDPGSGKFLGRNGTGLGMGLSAKTNR